MCSCARKQEVSFADGLRYTNKERGKNSEYKEMSDYLKKTYSPSYLREYASNNDLSLERATHSQLCDGIAKALLDRGYTLNGIKNWRPSSPESEQRFNEKRGTSNSGRRVRFRDEQSTFEEEEEEEEERSLGAEETCDGYSGMVYVARSGIDTMPSYNTGLLGNYGGRSSHFGYSSTYDGTVSYGRSSSVWGGPHDGRLNRCEYRWGNQFGRGCTINGRATAQSERERYNRRFFSD